MYTLKSRHDGFRLLLPKELIPEEITEKYTKILKSAKSYITSPIDFLNESIQKVQVFGFNNGTVSQQQTRRGKPVRKPDRIQQNEFLHTATDYQYRSVENPESLVDKTLNVDFKHTLGYLNYFILFESFMYQYSRDTKYLPDLDYQFNIDLFDKNGVIYSRIVLMDPLIDGIDMLDFDYTQPVASSSTFRCIFKYSNFDYQFIDTDVNTDFIYDEPFDGIIRKAKEEQQTAYRFKNYPYLPTERDIIDERLSNIDIHETIDNSRTYVDENGNEINYSFHDIPDYMKDNSDDEEVHNSYFRL